jgi:hypothetical protein
VRKFMHLVALCLGLSLTSEALVATQFPEVTFRPIAGDAAKLTIQHGLAADER